MLLAVALFVVAMAAWAFGHRNELAKKIGTWAFYLANISVLGTLSCLAVLFINNRFEFEYVWGHSDNRNAVPYRIAGIWSGQQGSFLLWASCAAIFGLLTAHHMGLFKRWYIFAYSLFLGMISAILAFESPFKLNLMGGKPVVPEDGFGLAPALQNYWVTIHPPIIFLGFGSLTVMFALAFAALMERNLTDWVALVRPWSIIALTLTGLGLCLGGFWAYETLGWGGFWMWDPVENVSFVPWCINVALVHGLFVQAAKKKWQFSNLLLAGAPFLTFLYGTFLTRSGYLSDSSVHSFAEMERTALRLLIGVMAICTVGFFALWATRMIQTKKETTLTEKLTKDRWVGLGMWSISIIGIMTMIGMSVPLIMAMRGEKPSVVPEGVYHHLLSYVFVPLMVLMGAAPFLSWRKTDRKKFWGRLYTVSCISIGIISILLFLAVSTGYNATINLAPTVTMLGRFQVNGLAWVMFLVALCTFSSVAAVWSAAERWRGSKLGTSGFIAHIGVAVLMTGLIISRGFERKDQTVLMDNHPARIMGYQLTYAGMTLNDRDRDNKVKIDVTDRKGKKLFTAEPGLYKTTMGDGQESVMVWPHIQRGWFHDTYIALGQPQTQGTQEVQVKLNDTVRFGNLDMTYLGMKTDGQFGAEGTSFGARIKVTGDGEPREILPALQLRGRGQTLERPALLQDGLNLILVSMNAADKSVRLRIDFINPMYPVEIFHKPLVSLVFLGTFIMTIAGLMAAWNRRPSKQLVAPEPDTDVQPEKRPETPTKELINSGSKK